MPAYPPFEGGSRKLFAILGRREWTPRPHALYAYAGGLACLAALLAIATAQAGYGGHAPLWAIGILAAVALLAEKQPVRVDSRLEMTVSTLPVLFAAVVFGPPAAMAVGAIGLIGEFRRPYVRWVIWTSLRALTGGLAGLSAVAVLGTETSFGRLVGAVVVAAVVEAACDVSLTGITVRLRHGGSWFRFMASMRPIVLVTVPLYASMVVLLAYAYREISGWSVLLFLGPAFAAQTLYRLYRRERQATDELRAVNTRLERATVSFATALVTTLDARDRYSAGHSAAVAVYARDIAKRLGLPEQQQQLAHLCGLVHDIGKVGLPPGLLEKPGPLTLAERRQMEAHAAIGERILSKVDGYDEIAKIVRHHHERVDGHGYPDGLAGEDVPLVSRIVSVADAYNAMTSDRPYRDAMATRVARLRLAQAVGSQFDTTVVAAFEAILATASESYRKGVTAPFRATLNEDKRMPAIAVGV